MLIHREKGFTMADMRLFKPDSSRCAEIWGTRDARDTREATFVGTSFGLLLIWSDGYIELQGPSTYLGDGYRLFTLERCDNAHNWPSDWPPREEVEAALLDARVSDADLLGYTVRSSDLRPQCLWPASL